MYFSKIIINLTLLHNITHLIYLELLLLNLTNYLEITNEDILQVIWLVDINESGVASEHNN